MKITNLQTQDVNWTYIRRSEEALDVFCSHCLSRVTLFIQITQEVITYTKLHSQNNKLPLFKIVKSQENLDVIFAIVLRLLWHLKHPYSKCQIHISNKWHSRFLFTLNIMLPNSMFLSKNRTFRRRVRRLEGCKLKTNWNALILKIWALRLKIFKPPN